jgi:hypothetical protein
MSFNLLICNRYWEARLNGRLPTDNNIDAWIRAKYQHKKWAQDGPPSEETKPTTQKPLETPLETKASSEDKENIQAAPQLIQVKKVLEQIEIKKVPQVIEKTVPALKKPHHVKSLSANPLKNAPIIDFASFQQQLSGLSTGQTNSGLIPKAPPGSNQSWTNFLNGQPSTDTTNNVLSQPSKEKPLIPLE